MSSTKFNDDESSDTPGTKASGGDDELAKGVTVESYVKGVKNASPISGGVGVHPLNGEYTRPVNCIPEAKSSLIARVGDLLSVVPSLARYDVFECAEDVSCSLTVIGVNAAERLGSGDPVKADEH